MPDYFPLSQQPYKKRLDSSPVGDRIKSTNVPPNLWLTAKDILHNLEAQLLISKDETNKEMTNSPIVIIPIEEDESVPAINVEALKPIASRNPITFVNMNGRPPQRRPIYEPLVTKSTTKRPQLPSKTFVDNFWSSRNNVSLIRKSQPDPSDVITFATNFPMETSTIGLRRPSYPWDIFDDPNKGIGSVEELQVPSPVNIYSPVIKTNLTPEVIPNLMQKLEDVSPLSPPSSSLSVAPIDASSPESYAPLSPPKDVTGTSYESYDSVPDDKLITTLKVQLQNSPIGQAINKGQWVYQSSSQQVQHDEQHIQQVQGFTKNSFHKGQLLEWIKNLEQDVQPTRRNPTTLETTTSTTPTTTVKSPSITTIDQRIGIRIPATTTTTTTTTTTFTTSSNASPKTLGEIVASAIAQSAAPLAGLSAATIAYGAAAMLPVWLPLALGKRKRRKRDDNTNEELIRSLINHSHRKYNNKHF